MPPWPPNRSPPSPPTIRVRTTTGSWRGSSSTVVTSPETAAAPPAFEVRLENFTGPFDLLLSLIAAHKMDVTEVALAVVTDDFIAHIRGQEAWDLSQASELLVIAATLLDLKAARPLPRAGAGDAEGLAR